MWGCAPRTLGRVTPAPSIANCAMKVSVIIPTYNDEGTIAAAVESALAQRFDGAFEVIVVNDGSNDGTRAELLKFGDRIHLIDQANAGVAVARNVGIAAAAGEYIGLLDGDDTFTEDKLSKTVAVLDRNPSCVAVFSNIVEVDGAGREISRYVSPEFAHPPTMDEMLERPWPFLPSALVIRRETLAAVGGFPSDFKADYYGGEDTFTMLLVRERGAVLYVPETLARRRLRDSREHYANRPQSRSIWDQFGGGIRRVRTSIRGRQYLRAIDPRTFRRPRPEICGMDDRSHRRRAGHSGTDGDA